MSDRVWPRRVGVVGLGIMGLAMARNMVAAGRSVVGFDMAAERTAEAKSAGVEIAASAGAVAQSAELLLTSLPSEGALDATVSAIIDAHRPAGQVVVELSTLSLDAKTRQQARLAAAGVVLLDSPVSGTGAQAAARDIVLYVSGDADAYARAKPVFADFAREAVYLGAFGNGTKMKFVANLLVAIHNVAAAEAVLLGLRAGLDPDNLVEILGSGAGGSRMLQVRGPMMVRESFEPATMKLDIWQKDMRLIAEFAAGLGVATPLFSATAPLYEEAVAEGRGSDDTAAVFTVVRDLSSQEDLPLDPRR